MRIPGEGHEHVAAEQQHDGAQVRGHGWQASGRWFAPQHNAALGNAHDAAIVTRSRLPPAAALGHLSLIHISEPTRPY